ncbi:MAG: hypothetical protein ABI091_06165 [Ferruginibacter sp.]
MFKGIAIIYRDISMVTIARSFKETSPTPPGIDNYQRSCIPCKVPIFLLKIMMEFFVGRCCWRFNNQPFIPQKEPIQKSFSIDPAVFKIMTASITCIWVAFGAAN